MNVTGFCASANNTIDENFYARRQKKIYVKLTPEDLERIRKSDGYFRSPVYDDRLIVSVTKYTNVAALLDRWCKYHLDISTYTVPGHRAGKRYRFISAEPIV